MENVTKITYETPFCFMLFGWLNSFIVEYCFMLVCTSGFILSHVSEISVGWLGWKNCNFLWMKKLNIDMHASIILKTFIQVDLLGILSLLSINSREMRQ